MEARIEMIDWKEKHANKAYKAVEHEIVERVIKEFMDNVNISDSGLPAYGIRKVAHYAAMVARAEALGFDPNSLRSTGVKQPWWNRLFQKGAA